MLGLVALVGVLIGWISDYEALGLSRTSLWAMGVRLVAAASAAPLVIATFAARPPAWIDRAKLFFLAAFPTLIIAGMTLHPTSVSHQGWAMVATWALLQLTILAPLRAKLLTGAGTLAVFGAHLAYLSATAGDAYGTRAEMLTVLACAAPCVFALPWLPHRMEDRRMREMKVRVELEREMELRKEHERELTLAKEAAERAEREAKEQKARADAAAEEARKAMKNAEREAHLRSQLFANMSHDLRTPMAGILGLVDLMRGTKLTEEQAGYVETIRASNQTLLALLNDVIDFARIEEGKLPLALASVPLIDTLRSPADLLRVTAERKGLSIRVELDAALPRFARVDPSRVQQILLNLLGNALKFTEHGSVTLRATVKDWADRKGLLRVEVEDTGIGFTAAQKERLFQRFKQAEDGTAQRFGGSGLGLSICAGLVGLMSGRIGADSAPGKGATFWFEIPIEESVAPSGGQGLVEVPPMRILLAEDNPVNQMVLGLMLKKLGHAVIVASDGRQALRLLSEQRFDLAVMDMQMPVIDGDEVTRRLRRLSGGAALTYVVALTAAVTPEQQAQYKAAGVEAVYTKPIDMERLRQMLERESPRALARSGVRIAASGV